LYAADRGADLVNVSLGGPDYACVLKTAIDYARGMGTLVVAADGNDSSAAAFYPAALPGVVGVSATDENDAFGSFSNYGPFVDISAPGNGILSAVPGGFMFASGTSMASPHVVGALALVRSLHPEWSEAQVLDAVAGSALDLGPWGRDDRFGNGRLRMSTAITAIGVDDTLPGLMLVNTPVTGTLGGSDPRDVYRLTLPKGGRLSVSLTSSLPTTLTVTTGSGATISSSAEQTSTSLSYAAPSAGTYGIRVAAGASNLSYKLSWKVQSPASLTLSGPSTVAWSTSATVKGTLKRPGGTPLVKAKVIVEAKQYGGTWKQVATRWTSETGAYSASVKPTMRTDYRVLFGGDNDTSPATSASVRITPKAYLTRPSTPSSPRAGVAFTSAGYLRPRHTTGARNVKLYCYRYESGKWRLRKSLYAKNVAYTSATTKYSARLSLPYRGRWRMRAFVAGDAKHASTYSSYRYVTVR
jgi:hypothetical protein